MKTYKMVTIPQERYDRMVESYDKELEELRKELEQFKKGGAC